MANRTPTLTLTLPGLGEFNNSWHTPVNSNMTKIDDWASAVNTEIQDARFNKSTLAAFLTVGHNSDGTLKPTEEVEDSRNSFLYGHKLNGNDLTLPTLSHLRDLEVWKARSGQDSMRAGIAFPRSFAGTKILSGSENINGYPAWAGFTGDKVTLNGSVIPIYVEIDGKICRIRSSKDVTISGPAGTYYIYADFQENGEVVFSALDGETGLDSLSEPRIHRDIGTDFSALNVRVGDLLKYNSPTSIAGDYLIEEIGPGSELDKLRITGLFPQSSISNIDYQITDPLGVTLGFSDAEVATPGRGFLVEADFDGTAVTAVRARHFGDTFVGEWRAIDVSSVGTFEESWTHKLGTDKIDVTVQVSQANNGSLPIEEISLATLTNTLGVTAAIGTLAPNVVNTLAYTPSNGTLSLTPGTQALTGAVAGSLSGGVAVTLTGAPTASLTGSINVAGSVKMKATRNQVWVKNVVSGVFYRDYDNVPRQTGYIRVLISKKG